MKKFAFIIMLAVLAACAPEKMVIVQIADAQLGFIELRGLWHLVWV